ncbi:MAG: hypothetical protein KAJ33_04480 [Thermoplasmata archaeon]|nr:hypothetical protein [Thermoplasmata archaeon]
MESAKEDNDLDQPEVEEIPYITDMPASKKSGRRFRSPTLKYGGGIAAVIGILWTVFAIAGSGTRVGRIFYVDSLPGLDVLALPLSTAIIGILLYIFVDE